MIKTILAYLFFLGTWWFSQLLALRMGPQNEWWTLLIFMTLFVGISGILVPAYLIRRLHYSFCDRRTSTAIYIGLGLLIAAMLAAMLGSGALDQAVAQAPGNNILVKYSLMFMPMALAVSLMCFFLIPKTVEHVLGRNPMSFAVAVVASSVAMFLGFYADSLFTDLGLAATMGILGAVFCAGFMLSRSFTALYVAFYLTMYVNTLAEAKYYHYPTGPLAGGFFFCCLALYFGIRQAGRRSSE